MDPFVTPSRPKKNVLKQWRTQAKKTGNISAERERESERERERNRSQESEWWPRLRRGTCEKRSRLQSRTGVGCGVMTRHPVKCTPHCDVLRGQRLTEAGARAVLTKATNEQLVRDGRVIVLKLRVREQLIKKIAPRKWLVHNEQDLQCFSKC